MRELVVQFANAPVVLTVDYQDPSLHHQVESKDVSVLLHGLQTKRAISTPAMIATSILFNSESAFWTRRSFLGHPFIAVSEFKDR